MSRVSQLSPELGRGVLQLARALLAAARHWALYPPEHPAVGQSLDRLADAINQATTGVILSIGVTPHTLLVEGAPADASQAAIADAAALLHDRDILQLTFLGRLPREALKSFLAILALDAKDRRERGGPAQIWAIDGHPSLGVDQIDYRKVLEREDGEVPEASRRDEIWRSIVQSISSGERTLFDERAQERLLAIAGSPGDIGDLATAVMAPKCAMDGSPIVTSQAATVLAAFRHLKSIVMVTARDRAPEVMSNVAAATAQLDPHVVMQMLQTEEDPADQLAVVPAMTAAFDDAKVAQLLATALALDGHATDRLAAIFNTIAPDEERKRRVLTLTRSMLGELDFGRSTQFHTLWTSMEELLVSYNEKPYVSESYRTGLDNVGGRAEHMAAVDLPPELPEWMETLGQDNVRALSVVLLIDLLSLESTEERAGGIAEDMAALAEDLLMSGAYADARAVIRALADRANKPDAVGATACRHVLDRLGESVTMREAAALIGDLEDDSWKAIRDVITAIGAPSSDALMPLVMVEPETLTAKRAADLLGGFGRAVVPRLATLTTHQHWYVQCAGARLLGRVGAAEGVPLLQPLLRRNDPRVARDAIKALGSIPDPAAARAIHTVLRAATGEVRRAIVDALVADRDPRVVPMLARIVEESRPLGRDHDVVLETLSALGTVGSDQAVAVLATIIRRRGFFGRRRLRRLKERGVDALATIGSARATAAINDAAQTGDPLLKKVIAVRRASQARR